MFGGRQFIFAVTIANHVKRLGYGDNSIRDYDYPISVTVDKDDFSPEDYGDFVNYINGIYLANDAFSRLVSYFENVDEPVVLAMFGDHCPSFSNEIMDELGISGTDYGSLKRQYSVPVLMWSRFNDKKIDFTGENINYLPQIVLEYAGLPESFMTQFLRYERGTFKANTRRFVEDANGRVLENYDDEQNKTSRHFKVVEYDFLFGSSSKRDSLWQPYAGVIYIMQKTAYYLNNAQNKCEFLYLEERKFVDRNILRQT